MPYRSASPGRGAIGAGRLAASLASSVMLLWSLEMLTQVLKQNIIAVRQKFGERVVLVKHVRSTARQNSKKRIKIFASDRGVA